MNQETLKALLAWQRRDYRISRRLHMNFKALEGQRMIIWALEKQVKTKPRWHKLSEYVSLSYCRCQEFTRNYFVNAVDHCPHCGQAMDWNEGDEE